MRFVLKNLRDTRALAQKLARKWFKQRGPLIIALYGNLGAGKTAFAQFFAKALGIKEKVLSPSFLIIKTFSLLRSNLGNWGGFKYKKLVHMDAYRLKSAKELIALGLKDILKDKENIVVIEWPEKVERYLPARVKRIYFDVIGFGERRVIIKSNIKYQK